MSTKSFAYRHIGPRKEDLQSMLEKIGVASIDELIEKTIPQSIRINKPLNVPEALTEYEYLRELKKIASKNKVNRSYIGMGYYNTITPNVILRNVFENPGWYTAYTPYQAEISQGRLEALLNFQTVVCDLTAMEIANASLLDEGTAAAEAMMMFYNNRSRKAEKEEVNKFFVSESCFPQTIDVVKTRAEALGIEIIIGTHEKEDINETFFGALVQYPAKCGEVYDYKEFAGKCRNNEVNLVVAADILSLAILTPPGEWGADAVVGSTQRFGIPLGYGGPHAAYFATKDEFKRKIPGRIIGVSKDRLGNPALRMALQTREQHIRRDKATSNICTAQALLAVMAGFYAIYHGSIGIKEIATDVFEKANFLKDKLLEFGYSVINKNIFDTITVEITEVELIEKIKTQALSKGINFWYEESYVRLSIDESVLINDLQDVLNVFRLAKEENELSLESYSFNQKPHLSRTSDYLTNSVFELYHSESEMMRYLKRLENRDLSLTHSMISLGSCTMKLNAATQLIPVSWAEFSSIHPFAPLNQVQGYQQIITELENYLAEITGFTKVSLQPNSGAQGEYAGLLTIKAYHDNNNDTQRKIILIPSSAHGTNPASAVIAGFNVVVIKCDEKGNINIDDLKEKAKKYSETLAGLMVTYPSTHGVFEEGIKTVTSIIHENGGLVYMDGANMNAQVGLTSPGEIGADVCHLNLHKTFAIPHGGGGPGMGPIAVNNKLAPFLPSNPIVKTGGEKGIGSISAAPWGSASILLISYGYIKMLGANGLKKATEYAILNANYLKALLTKKYNVLYTGKNGTVAHEMIIDCQDFKKSANIEVADIAKRLIDYGFHAPTVSFPVNGTLMIEPTESESKEELDRFAEALNMIHDEITEISKTNNLEQNIIKNAPHTLKDIQKEWGFNYTINQAIFPVKHLQDFKFFSYVNKIDNAFGDKNLICTCPSIESYESELVSI